MAPIKSTSFSGTEEKSRVLVDYSYFYNAATKLRSDNYLKNIGDKVFNAGADAFKFSNGDPNPQCSPYHKAAITLRNGEILEMEGKELEDALSYMTIKGYQPFLDLLKHFQDRLHGKQDWKMKNITTTSGSQGALYQIVEMFVSSGDPVLVQGPFYPGMISILQHLQIEFIEVDSDLLGISVKHLATVLHDRKIRGLAMPKIFYINPTGTNPTGEIIPVEKKMDIYKIACEYNLLILEDDPYFLLTYENKIPLSFLALDTENRVIRFDSFSKTLGAGFRVGYVTACKEVITKLNLIKGSSAMASPFCQVILHNTLVSMKFKGFLHHMRSISEFYKKNCEKVLYCLDKYMKDVAVWNAPEAAMFVWITIKDTVHISDAFMESCIKNLVFLCPGFAFYGKVRKCPCIRLAFSMINENRIEEGIRKLSRLIKEELNKCS